MPRQLLASSLFVLALSVGGATASGAASGSGSGTVGGTSTAWLPWVDCAFDGSTLARPRDFDCMALQVPLCYSDLAVPCTSNGTHTLRIMRRQTNKKAAVAPTVWVVADSSDQAKTADLMERIARQQGGTAINVYAMETRHSNPPVSEKCGELAVNHGMRLTIDGDMLDAVAKCSQWISTSLGVNGASALSLDSAARDLAAGLRRVQEKELKANADVYVLSLGKASRVVQRLMIRSDISNTTFAGFIFDTPHAMKLSPTQDEIIGASTSRFLDGCESDALCRGFYTNLSMSMRDALVATEKAVDLSNEGNQSECIHALYEASYIEGLKPSQGLRRYIVGMRQRMSAYQVIAPLLYRAHRCEDVKAFNKMVDVIGQLHDGVPVVPRVVSSMVDFVDRVVAYSEFWPTPMPSRDQLVKSVDVTVLSDGPLLLQQPSYCIYHATNSSVCAGFYKRTLANASRALVYSPQETPTSSKTTGLVGSSSADVLILTSRISTVASAVVSEEIYEAFTAASGSSLNRTAVLIQSDNPAATELGGDHSELLLRVVGQFVTRQAKPLAGKWYIDDLSGASSVSVVSDSTLESAPVRVNFTLTALEMAYLKVAIGYDPYEKTNSSLFDICHECEAEEESKKRTFVILVCVATGLFFAWLIWFSCFRETKQPTATTPAAPPIVVTSTEVYQPYYYPSQQQHPSSAPTSWSNGAQYARPAIQ